MADPNMSPEQKISFYADPDKQALQGPSFRRKVKLGVPVPAPGARARGIESVSAGIYWFAGTEVSILVASM